MNEFLLPAPADASHSAGVAAYLTSVGLIGADEPLTLEPAGAGNMNCVWRARLPTRTLILKQARAWVEKYPTIAAPAGRAEAEARFYRFVETVPTIASRMPKLLYHDAAVHLLVFSDLAPAVTLDDCYTGERRLDLAQINALADWLRALHALRIPTGRAQEFQNRAMRELNHAHIFDLPLRPEGLFDGMLESLTPGLAALAKEFRGDVRYRAKVAALGERYLHRDTDCLIHGDFFLGSLLRQPDGETLVIDPEFSFGGDPAFDVGVGWAHLLLTGHSVAICDQWLEQALPEPGPATRTHAENYAGVEIMRRLIGVAQLPLIFPLETKRRWLERSRALVLAT